jgi:hypothetical protein
MAEELKTVVTDRAANTAKMSARTILVALSPLRIVLTRAARVYVQSLVGFLTAVMTGAAGAAGVQVPAGDFWTLLLSCASLAVAPAAMSLLMNIAELLGKWDETRPELRA